MYLLNLTYIKKLAEVELQNPAHVDWVKKYRADGTFLFASPKKSGLGGIIGARSMDKKELLRILAEDSYVIADVGEYQITDVEIKLSPDAYAAMKAD